MEPPLTYTGGVLQHPPRSKPLTVETIPDDSPDQAIAPPVATTGRQRVWGALAAIRQDPALDVVRNADFRLIWLGQSCTSMGMWMDQVARGWLLYQLTDSPLQLGLLQGMQALPIFFLSPIAGAAADRYDRKLQIMIAQVLDGLMYAVVAWLILSDLIQPWHVYATAFTGSVVSTFHQPARAAMIADAVSPRDLTKAVALTSVTFNVSRTFGPALAGLLIALVGTAGSYIAQSTLYVLSSALTVPLPAALRFPSGPRMRRAGRLSLGRSILEGWKASWHNETVRVAIYVVTSASIFILPFTTLLPVFARDILKVGASGQGMLLTAMGIGAFCSSVLVAFLGDRLPRGMLMLCGVTLYGIMVAAFAASPWFPLSVVLMVVVGIFHVSTHTLTQIVVQAYTPAEFQGRTMAVLQQTHVIQMAGGLLIGGVAVVVGAPWAVAGMAAVGTIAAVAMFIAVPAARRIQ